MVLEGEGGMIVEGAAWYGKIGYGSHVSLLYVCFVLEGVDDGRDGGGGRLSTKGFLRVAVEKGSILRKVNSRPDA